MTTTSPEVTGPDGRLYAWQADAIRSWKAAGRRGIIEAVTGTGKTRVGESAIEEAVSQGRSAVVLVPTKELQRQWHATLRGSLPDRVRVGLLGDGKRDELCDNDVLVAIIDSARNRDIEPPSGSLLVADECHRYASPTNGLALLDRYEHRLGLTATLERPDRAEQDLLAYFGPICYRIGFSQALVDAVVAQFSLTLIGVQMTDDEAASYQEVSRRISDLYTELTTAHGFPKDPFHRFMQAVKDAAEERKRSQASSPSRAFLAAVFERKSLMARSTSKLAAALDLAPAIWFADRTLVFTESVEVAKNLATDLRESGLRAAAIHSEVDPTARRSVLQQFKSGALEAIVAPRVLDEGVDVPAADLAVIVSASRTRRQMIQRMGRVLRRKHDGRLARIVILYLQETTEDPARGAHEAFLGEVTSVAEDLEDFTQDQLEDALVFLCISEPIRPSREPRMEGDPTRASGVEVFDDESVRAAEYLGLA